MSDTLNFRSAFHGFNREDVVHYIEYLNAKHASELSQLRAELEAAREGAAQPSASESTAAEPKPEAASYSQEDWDALIEARMQAEFDRDAAIEARNLAEAERDAALAEKNHAQAVSVQQRDIQLEELEAYRRAERTERVARERAEKIYHTAGTALSCATTRVDETFAQIDDLAALVTQHLHNLQCAVTESKQALSEAVESLDQIRPEE